MESNNDFDLTLIIQSFDEDLSRVANPEASRGHDYFGYYAQQIRQCLNDLSKDDVLDIIKSTESDIQWKLKKKDICEKYELLISKNTEYGIILKIFVSIMASAAQKKIIIFNGVYSFKLGLGKNPEATLRLPFLFCFSKFSIELYLTGSAHRYQQSKEYLEFDWGGIELQHEKVKTWLKSTIDIFSYMCAYGIKSYSDINPVTVNEYRISRSNFNLGAMSHSPVLKFLDGKYLMNLNTEMQSLARKKQSTSSNDVKKAKNIGQHGFRLLSNSGSRKRSCESIAKGSFVLEPVARSSSVEIEDYIFQLGSLSDFSSQYIDKNSKWAKSQLDYLYSDESEKGTVKGRESALRYLNVYLFDYLPYFFSITDTVFKYPEDPEQFLSHVFIKKSMVMDEFIQGEIKNKIYPLSFIDFISLCTKENKQSSSKGNNLLRDSLAVISRYFNFIITEYSAIDGYKISKNPFTINRKKSGSKYDKSSKTKFDFQYWIYFRHFIKVISKHAVLHAVTTLKNSIERHDLHELDAEISSIEKEIKALIKRSDAEKITYLQNDSSQCVNILNINESINFTDDLLPLVINDVDLKDLKSKRFQLTDSGFDVSVVHYQALLSIVISCYAGQRASNAAWLCADTFDQYYTPENNLSDDGLVDIHVFTDKVKSEGIDSKIPKDIMSLLLISRRLRGLNKNPSIANPINYQNNEKSKKGVFRPLMQTNHQHQVPHYNLSPFICMFEDSMRESSIEFESTLNYTLYNMRVIEFNYLKKIDNVPFTHCYKINNYPDKNFVPYSSVALKSELTVHSLRKQLDSVLDVMVNDRDVIRMFTGQSDAVIGYYAENTPEEEKEIIDSARALLPELVTPFKSQIDEKEALESQFAGTFVQDYKPITTHGTREIGSGIDDLQTSDELAFNWTHICPFGNNCPNEVVAEVGRMNCHICPKAIMTKFHKASIASLIRTLVEDICDIDSRINESGMTKSDLQQLKYEKSTKLLKASSWNVRHDLLKNQDVVVLDVKGVLANMVYLKPGTFKHSLYLKLKENEDSPALQSNKIRKVAERLSRKLIRAIPDLKNLVEFSDEKFDDNPVKQALNTLNMVAEYTGVTVEKLLESSMDNHKKIESDKALLGVFK